MFFSRPSAVQRQGIFSIERELANDCCPVLLKVMSTRRFCVSVTTFKFFRVFCRSVPDSSLDVAHQMFYLLGRHVLFFSIRFGRKICFRYAESDKEAFCNVNAALGKTLIVFRCSAAICMAVQREMRIGLLPRSSGNPLAGTVDSGRAVGN